MFRVTAREVERDVGSVVTRIRAEVVAALTWLGGFCCAAPTWYRADPARYGHGLPIAFPRTKVSIGFLVNGLTIVRTWSA